MAKSWNSFITILILLGVIAVLYLKFSVKSTDETNCKAILVESYKQQSGMLQEIDSLKTIISWLQEQITQELTWVSSEEVSVILYYPKQPVQAIWNYEGNSRVLNLYSRKTSQLANLTQDFKGQIVIKLRKAPTTHTIIYFKTDIVSCVGRLNEPINDNNEFTLSMDGFNVGTANCILKNKDGTFPDKIRVGWYVANFDWNGIETITFK